jgi:hypothetical protein
MKNSINFLKLVCNRNHEMFASFVMLQAVCASSLLTINMSAYGHSFDISVT